jgi:glycosyltransferase involved in cell wall biosynthesis
MSPPAPAVSVVIATHDRRCWLAEAVASVQAQKGVAWELVVVDDASKDGTAEWLAAQAGPLFQVCRLASPSERSVARNTGLARARGRWVMFLDDDDRLRPDALHALVSAAEFHRSVGSAVGNRCHDFGPGDARNYNEDHATKPCVRSIWPELVFGWSAVSGQNLFRTDIVRAVGGYNPKLILCEDRELWLKIACRAPTAIAPQVTLEYRQHPGQQRPADILEIRERIFAEFAAQLPSTQQSRCAKLRISSRAWLAAEAAFQQRERVGATRHTWRAITAAPGMLFSPLVGAQRRAWAARILRRFLLGWR